MLNLSSVSNIPENGYKKVIVLAQLCMYKKYNYGF